MNKQPLVNQPAREPFYRVHRNFFVGLFIMVPLILIPLFLIYTFSRTELFQKWLNLAVCTNNAYGFKKGSTITISGMRVGYVNDVDLAGPGRIIISLRVQRQYGQLIRKTSHARLTQPMLGMGDAAIILTPGDSFSPLAAEGDTLTPEIPSSVDDLINQVKTLVATIDTLVQGVGRGEGLVGHVLKDENMVKKVDAILVNVDKTVVGAGQTMANLDKTLASVTELTRHFTTTSDSLNATVAKVAPLLDDARKLIASLDKVSTQTPQTIDNVNKDLHEVKVLLRGLEEHWLFRGAVKKAKEKDPELEKE